MCGSPEESSTSPQGYQRYEQPCVSEFTALVLWDQPPATKECLWESLTGSPQALKALSPTPLNPKP